jgi:hypothetical protein
MGYDLTQMLVVCCCPEKGFKLLGLLSLLGRLVSTWQVGMGWPDVHWLARDQGGLVAAIN